MAAIAATASAANASGGASANTNPASPAISAMPVRMVDSGTSRFGCTKSCGSRMVICRSWLSFKFGKYVPSRCAISLVTGVPREKPIRWIGEEKIAPRQRPVELDQRGGERIGGAPRRSPSR